MFDALKYNIDLWKLQREKDKNKRFYSKKIAEAEKKKYSDDGIDSIVREEVHEIGMVDEEIARVQGLFLVSQAEKYLIPLPKFNTDGEDWEESRITGRWRLSQKSISELKSAIREEQKDRREKWQGWLALLIGLVGALIGLTSVL